MFIWNILKIIFEQRSINSYCLESIMDTLVVWQKISKFHPYSYADMSSICIRPYKILVPRTSA